MLKTAMLVSALAICAPALAQDGFPPAKAPQTPPVAAADPAVPRQDAPTPMTAQNAPPAEAAAPTAQVATPVDPATPAAPAEPATPTEAAAVAATPATPAPSATPVTGASEIAAVVDTEFPSYDRNADTSLDKAEFAAWMVALKTASDPATRASDPATVAWIDGAFASADADKSKAVSKTELTKYLSQGAE